MEEECKSRPPTKKGLPFREVANKNIEGVLSRKGKRLDWEIPINRECGGPSGRTSFRKKMGPRKSHNTGGKAERVTKKSMRGRKTEEKTTRGKDRNSKKKKGHLDK